MPSWTTTRRRLLLGGLASLAAAGLGSRQGVRAASQPRSGDGAPPPRQQRVRALVIGSGFGGAVAAYRLSQKGIDTLVLERGRRWTTRPGTSPFATSRNTDGRALWLSEVDLLVTDGPKDPVDRYVGLVERYNEDGIMVWTSTGVGGGSLVYNTVLLQPSRDNFYRCFPREVSYDEMDRDYYRRVVQMLGAGPIPDDVLLSSPYLGARLFKELANRAGVPHQRINTAIDWNVVRQELRGELEASATAGEIWYGGNSGYKNSLDKNYLKQAEDSGKVRIQELSNVVSIHAADKGFLVEYERIDERGNRLSLHRVQTDLLFLGAGSMGTSSLLTRAKYKQTLPKLNNEIGRHWGTNGDTFGTINIGKPAGSDQGGPAHIVALDYQDNPFGPQTIIGFPQANNLPDTMIFLGMSIPSDSGHWDFDPVSDRARLHWPTGTVGAKQTEDRMEFTLKKLARAVTPEAQAEAAVRSIKVSAGATAHPCGGAAMGKACDLHGRVAGYSGLYVVDSAFIPLGTAAANPALTIAAFAERSMDHILANDL